MTAATVEPPASRGPRGLLWTVLRLHRAALWCWLLLVAVGVGTLLWAYGPGVDAAWAEYHAMGCDNPSPNLGCDYTGPAYGRYDMAVALGAGLLGLVPLLAGAWAGGALIGRELESGTAQLTWTQSVSPVHWLIAKLAAPAALLVPGTLALTLLHRQLWSSDARSRHMMGSREWYESMTFVANGTLATAHALLGLAVGALAGLLLRRALPALATATLSLLALLYALAELRPHLWPAVTTTSTAEYPDGNGMPVDVGAHSTDYHPATHFWPLQLMETTIVLTLTALTLLTAFRLLTTSGSRRVRLRARGG
jgi:hypothetical protein